MGNYDDEKKPIPGESRLQELPENFRSEQPHHLGGDVPQIGNRLPAETQLQIKRALERRRAREQVEHLSPEEQAQFMTLRGNTQEARRRRTIMIDRVQAAWARRHDYRYSTEQQLKPSFWKELYAGVAQQIGEPIANFARGLAGAAKQNVRHTNELLETARERNLPVNPIGAPFAVAVTDTAAGVQESLEEATADLQRAVEAETAADKALQAFMYAKHIGAAALQADALVSPAVSFGEAAAGGMAAGGGGEAIGIAGVSGDGAAAATMGGGATATGAPLPASSSSLPRLIVGVGQDVGNPVPEDKTMHEGDAAQQQKAEKRDARDAAFDRPDAKSKLARHLPPAGPSFQLWFDALTVKRLEEFWADSAARKIIEDNIRHPGGLHEWLQVAEAQRFKQWNVTMDVIQDARTLTSETFGKGFKHGGTGSGDFHRTIRAMIQSAPDFESFVARLNDWADENLVNGRHSLPENLQR